MKYIGSIKETLKNPKKRSLILIGFYLIFFIFVFILLNNQSMPSATINQNNQNENTNESDNIESYTYTYTLNGQIIFESIYKDNTEIFTYNGLTYYKNSDLIYLNNEIALIDINVDYFKYDNIKRLIDNSEFIKSTTYKDDTKETTYSIDLGKFNSIMGTIYDDTDSEISFVVNENVNINSVTIDLSSYYNYSYEMKINYSNINNISDINFQNIN